MWTGLTQPVLAETDILLFRTRRTRTVHTTKACPKRDYPLFPFAKGPKLAAMDAGGQFPGPPASAQRRSQARWHILLTRCQPRCASTLARAAAVGVTTQASTSKVFPAAAAGAAMGIPRRPTRCGWHQRSIRARTVSRQCALARVRPSSGHYSAQSHSQASKIYTVVTIPLDDLSAVPALATIFLSLKLPFSQR